MARLSVCIDTLNEVQLCTDVLPDLEEGLNACR